MKIQVFCVVASEIQCRFSIATVVVWKRHTYVMRTLSVLTSFFRDNLLLGSLETKNFPLAQQPLLGQDLLIIQTSRSHSVRQTIFSRTPLDEWSSRHRDFYLMTHNTHNRQTFMPVVRFEPAIPASERLQIYALDRTVAGIGQNPSTDYLMLSVS